MQCKNKYRTTKYKHNAPELTVRIVQNRKISGNINLLILEDADFFCIDRRDII